jgi:hypothetical protein
MSPTILKRWLSHGPRPSHVGQDEPTVAILVGARSLIGRGWLQGGWYVLETRDGRRHAVLPGSLMPRGNSMVVRSCLVGAVLEAARWHGREHETAGPAIDALWDALWRAEGRGPQLDVASPSPSARRLRVRELTRWNDHPDRTRDHVLGLLDLAIGEVEQSLPVPASPSAASDAGPVATR